MCISVTRHRHHRRIGRPAELQTDLATLLGVIAVQLPEAAATSPHRPVSSQVRSAIDAVRSLAKTCAHRGSNVRSSPAVVATMAASSVRWPP